ncbi:MAG: ABC transporter permease [Mycobacterium sp.]|nr:ABC transporter permease [Mycobacterium sp.]
MTIRRATHSPSTKAAAIVVGLTAILAVILVAFGLPASRSAPHDVPIGVSGPAAVTEQVRQLLDQKSPDAFAVTAYADDAALRAAIRNREAYGGISFDADRPMEGGGPTLLTASGASPMIAQLLNQVGAGLAAQSGAPLRTQDLAPLPAGDPRGVGLAASALPLTLAGLLPAYVFVLLFKREVWLRFASTVVFAGVAALTVALLLRYLFGSIDQNLWGVTAGLVLGALAMGLPVLGLGSLFGKAGLGVGAAVTMLLGNPFSGLSSAPEVLPRGWGAFGQLLPQGANATLLRSTAYFDGAGAASAVAVLLCWATAGVALVAIAAIRGPGSADPRPGGHGAHRARQ